jgi:muramoyltetrapeptide carboxypeptidase LdcA involved in peptidoglycan recycling
MKFNPESHKPDVLKPGDEVTLVSPVNIPPKQYRNYETYREYLTKKGFRTPESFHTSDTDTVSQRVNLFNMAIRSGAKALFPVAGNAYAGKVLHRIDYEAFEKEKPIFCTFSAASVLLMALHERSRVPVFYGPHLSFISSTSEFRRDPFAEDSFWNMIMQKDEVGTDVPPELAQYVFKWNGSKKLTNLFAENPQPSKNNTPRYFIGEKTDRTRDAVQGNLFPAFLQSLEIAIDKGLEVDFTDNILLLESDQIDYDAAFRMLQNINDKRALDKASAIVFAGITHHPHKEDGDHLANTLYDEDIIRRFTDRLRRLTKGNIPVLFGFPMGHGDYKLTIPFGPAAELHLESGDITLLESPFTEATAENKEEK